MNCDCQLPVVIKKVSKEGENLGKEFYCCSKNSCRFFQWANGTMPLTAAIRKPSSAVPQAKGSLTVKLSLASYDVKSNTFWFACQRY